MILLLLPQKRFQHEDDHFAQWERYITAASAVLCGQQGALTAGEETENNSYLLHWVNVGQHANVLRKSL